MIFRLFYDSIIGFIIGNIFELTKKLLGKTDQEIWASRYYYQYSGFKDYLFIILWIIMAISLGYFFTTFPEFQGTGAYYIGSFFFIAGFLLAARLPHTLDKFYIYSNRLEKKTLLHTTYTIPFNSIESVVENSQNLAIITYHDKTFGLLTLETPWKIPIKIFTDPRLNLLNSKLHLNPNGLSYTKSTPPQQITFNDTEFIKKLLIISVLLLNPYTLILGSAFFFGVFFSSPLLLLLTDLSKAYCSFCLRIINRKSVFMKS